MKYHSSTKVKHCDRLSVLKKLEDKYNFDNVEFPASYDDIETFENNNQIDVQTYAMNGDNIIKEYYGNKYYLLNDRIYLLIIEN